MQKRERIYIVPHWAGLTFGILVLLIFATGFLARGSRDLTQTLVITLVVAGVVALIQSNENLRGVAVTGCRSIPVAAGEDAVLELTLRNVADRERIGLRVRGGWRTPLRTSICVPVLDAGKTVTVRLGVPTSRRGRFPVPTLWVCSVMPVGLCFAWKAFPACGEYVVYPAPRGRTLEYESEAGVKPGALQEHQGGDDVSGHRPYEPGDMLSRLDWRVFARTGKLVVRAMDEGGGNAVALRWEDTAFLENPEERLEQLSFWIAQCVREDRPFTLAMENSSGRKLNSRNLALCQEALATFGDAI